MNKLITRPVFFILAAILALLVSIVLILIFIPQNSLSGNKNQVSSDVTAMLSGKTSDKIDYLKSDKTSLNSADLTQILVFLDQVEYLIGDDTFFDHFDAVYDNQINTVYVCTKKANLAFKLDDNGNIVYVSANGDAEIKAELSRAIAKVFVGTGMADTISDIFGTAGETRWLNAINCEVLMAQANDDAYLQSLLPEFDLPALAMADISTSDLEKAQLMENLEYPSFTESLKSSGFGANEMTNYYESPSLTEYWTGTDFSNIKSEITENESTALKERSNFESISLESYDFNLSNFQLDSYSLPSSFSDGTSTTLGKSTASAFTNFESSLLNYRDNLWDDFETAQSANTTEILNDFSSAAKSYNSTTEAKAEALKNDLQAKLDAMETTINEKQDAVSNTQTQNQSSVTEKNTAANENLQTAVDDANRNMEDKKAEYEIND